MRKTDSRRRRGRPLNGLRAGVLLLFWAVSALPALGLPSISFDPPSTLVALGDTFDLVLWANEDTDTFANFQVILRFDPVILGFVEAVEGSLYTETGLPTWFHVEEESVGTWEVFDVILHGQEFVVAPGEVARIRFEALSYGVSPVDMVSAVVTDRDPVPLDPLYWSNAIVFVDDITDTPSAAPPLRWENGPPIPNPSRDAVRFRISVPNREASPGGAVVYDTRGRRVRDLLIHGPGYADWDGRDAWGVQVAPGIYFLRWATPEGVHSRRITRVR